MSERSDAQEMAALFIGMSARGNFDAVTIDDLVKWFEISDDEAMEVLYQIGSATLGIHFEGCTCEEMEAAADIDDIDDLLAQIRVGDPDVTCEYGDEYDCCPERSGPWHCTRLEGHTGIHVAGDGEEICAVWP